MDFETMLFDRIEIIKLINKQFDLENNSYISFSGGKDSVILSYLVDLAIPNNKIPRVYINTGIEFVEMVKYVKSLAVKDDRIIIINPSQPIKNVLDKYGYPFKSKEHSKKVNQYFKTKIITPYLQRYIDGVNKIKKYACPDILKYQFTENNKLHISNLCCKKIKEEPLSKWQKENKKSIALLGLRRDEGGARSNIKNCVFYNKNNQITKFYPLLVVDDNFEKEFLKKYNIKLCCLYYEPYNFVRTGCKGCPFAITLREELESLSLYLPNERKQCEIIWGPVYSEYRRLNFRLSKNERFILY